ncbi:MAG TPA: SCO family protein [Xanthobacteraceae bacterium]|jgi:protein SCO1/2|nr:SCO family protein [Xanthobacteraceae bacterium]
MTAQTSRLILIIAAFVAGLVLCLSVVLLVAQRGSVPLPQASAVGGPFKLIDQNGRTVTEQDMMGKPFLVFFGFTHCPDVCPTTLFDISEVFRKLGPDADRAAALFITVDPERDTPEAMKNYLSSFDPHLRGLTGDEAAVDGVIKTYRAYSKKVPNPDGSYTMDHTALVYLMDKDGRFVAPFNLKRRPEDSATDLRRYF